MGVATLVHYVHTIFATPVNEGFAAQCILDAFIHEPRFKTGAAQIFLRRANSPPTNAANMTPCFRFLNSVI
jgi:hypothetical protein